MSKSIIQKSNPIVKEAWNIFPIWQDQGLSTHVIATKIAENIGKKTSHTGTIDPMAEGVIIILADEDRNKKYEFAKWKKGYEFVITLGFGTDTLDGLGKITKIGKFTPSNICKKKIEEICIKMQGDYVQSTPVYSAIKVKGKPLHWWARNNKINEIDIPKRYGKIYKFQLLGMEQQELGEASRILIKKLGKITGNLRQKEIAEEWQKYSESKTLITNIRLYAETSKGIYIRQLAQDLLTNLEHIGFTSELTRTKNGTFTKEQCIKLSDYFGPNFRDILKSDTRF